MVDVFISYSRATRNKVEPIKRKLEALGLDCFFDMHQIDGGANFPDVIDRALRDSKSVLCCWSPQYFKGQWSMIECRDAMARGLIVPVAVERFEQFAPPADLRQINWFDLVEWGGEDDHEDWGRTLLNLGKLIGRDLIGAVRTPVESAFKLAEQLPLANHEAQLRATQLEDMRATWAAFPDKADIAAVEQLLGRVRAAVADSGFEFELEYHLDGLRRDAQRRAEKAQRAEAERLSRLAAEEAARQQALAQRCQPGKVWRDTIPGMPEDTVPEMVTLPPGSAAGIGAEPGDPFALSRFPVTFADLDAAIAVGADLDWPADGGLGRNRRAVVNLNWHDAQAYVAWLNGRLGLTGRFDAYRLPSAAEWNDVLQHATMVAPSAASPGARLPAEVGDFPVNDLGLSYLPGQLSEWCADSGEQADARMLCQHSPDTSEPDAKVQTLAEADCTIRREDIGFRLARTLVHRAG